MEGKKKGGKKQTDRDRGREGRGTKEGGRREREREGSVPEPCGGLSL